MKKLLGLWTSLLSLCFLFSSSGDGLSKSFASYRDEWKRTRVRNIEINKGVLHRASLFSFIGPFSGLRKAAEPPNLQA